MVKPRENRVPIMMSDDELASIDDWRFENRVATRSAAIRRLCKIALLVEQELENIVDYATDGVRYLHDHLDDALNIRRKIDPPGTEGLSFDIEEMRDVLRVYIDTTSNAVEAMTGVQMMIVTLYNAITPIAQDPTISGGISKSEKAIEHAIKAVEDANEKQKQSAENRYIALYLRLETPEERAKFDALPEDMKDAAIEEKINALAAEEENDPEAFYSKYNLWPFWEKPEWAEKLDTHKSKESKGAEQ